jgi:hypothetical protein
MKISRITHFIYWLKIASISLSCATVGAVFAQAGFDEDADIRNYFELRIIDPAQLGEQIQFVAQPALDQIETEVEAEVYISRLREDDYAVFLARYIENLSDVEFSELLETALQPAFALYIDEIGANDFATIYRQFLGEMTSTYLTLGSDVEFTEYVLSRILQLSPDQYSTLYQDYVRTLWRYFVDSASPQELLALLGEGYEAILATADFSIDNPAFFDDVYAEIIDLSEAEFAAIYSDYVAKMIGGLIDDPSILEMPVNATDGTTETQDNALPAVDSESENGTTAIPESPPLTGLAAVAFTDLNAAESLNLLRLHIATIARNYFIVPFKADLVQRASVYTASATEEQLANLRNLEPISTMIEESRLSYNQRNQETLASIERLLDEEVLGEVTDKLGLVDSIPYPNERLLGIAINKALAEFRPNSGSDVWGFSQVQYQILLTAVFDLVRAYNKRDTLADGVADLARPGVSLDISWNFLGCGCDIDQNKVIYGFYPSWAFPEPGVAQEIDLRYYDRVAYFGMTLNRNAEIDAGEYWRAGGPMNDFIIGAHHRMTEVDLAVYVPYWQEWDERHFSLVSTNIIDMLKIPLQYGTITNFAKNYLQPIYPTYSETIGRDYMGDGVTLLFDSLRDPETLEVRDLTYITRLIERLARDLKSAFGEDAPPINLMLDVNQSDTAEVLRSLRTTINGSQADPDQYISRLLLFLEQDTWDSSQQLIEAVRTVFVNNDSSAVLEKLNPILIPAMDDNKQFSSLSRDLVSMRGIFGEAGGAAIWPIPEHMPLENSGNEFQIEKAFVSAMVVEETGLWADIESTVESFYFRDRSILIFSLTLFYTISLVILMWSIREPLRAFLLVSAKIIGGLTFILFVLLLYFDPYLNWWRVAYFVLPLMFVIFVVPMQNVTPPSATAIPGNKYMNRGLKRERTRVLRGMQRSIRNAIWNRDAD